MPALITNLPPLKRENLDRVVGVLVEHLVVVLQGVEVVDVERHRRWVEQALRFARLHPLYSNTTM